MMLIRYTHQKNSPSLYLLVLVSLFFFTFLAKSTQLDNNNNNDIENKNNNNNNPYNLDQEPINTHDKDNGDDDDDTPPTTTIIDILSSNGNFSKLLISLQKSDLIDFVSGLENVTFLAPLNSAFDQNDQFIKLSKKDFKRCFINQPVSSSDVDGVQIYQTLDTDGSPFIPELDMPILLDNRDSVFMVEQSQVIEPDLIAESSNSIVHGIDGFVEAPSSLCELFQKFQNYQPDIENFQVFSALFSSHDYCTSNQVSNVTLLLPLDKGVNFNEIELRYLETELGSEDKTNFLNNYMVPGIIGGNLNDTVIEAINFNGDNITLSTDLKGNELIVDDQTESFLSNYLVSDAVIHFFDNLIFDNSKLPLFTPRSYLIGLNQTSLVKELDFRKLSKLIDNIEIEQTFFIVSGQDDSFSSYGQAKNNLLYQFMDGKHELDHNFLVDSKFCSANTLGHCQKLMLTIDEAGTPYINRHSQVISEKIEVGNTYIYFIDDSISLPSKLESAVSPFLKCAKTMQFLDHFSLLKFKENSGLGYTVFLPTSEAWNELDLTLDYLLDNLKILESLMKSMILNGLVYDSFSGKQTLQNENGDAVQLHKGISDDMLYIDNTPVSIDVKTEVLFKDGVAFPVDKVLFPEDLTISMKQLIDTVDGSEFLKILDILGLSSLMEDSDYSFIIPSSKSLTMDNITSSIGDLKYLEKFAKLHILPGDSLDRLLKCESTIPTLLNGTHLSCRELASGNFMLQILEGNDHEVRVLRKGFTTMPSGSKNSGLLVVDRPINPRWLDSSNGPIHLHLPFVAILIGVIIGMFGLLLVVSCCLVCSVGRSNNLSKSSTSNDLEAVVSTNSNSSNNAESRPLISRSRSLQNQPLYEEDEGGNGTYGSAAIGGRVKKTKSSGSFSGYYSTHSSSKPIDMNFNRS